MTRYFLTAPGETEYEVGEREYTATCHVLSVGKDSAEWIHPTGWQGRADPGGPGNAGRSGAFDQVAAGGPFGMGLGAAIRTVTEDPPLSRVHELGRMPFLDLVALYHRLADTGDGIAGHLQFKDRDQVISAIRRIEDPRWG